MVYNEPLVKLILFAIALCPLTHAEDRPKLPLGLPREEVYSRFGRPTKWYAPQSHRYIHSEAAALAVLEAGERADDVF